MRLLVDAGNSRLKWRLVENGRVVSQAACDHRGRRADEVLAQAWAVLPEAREIFVANVAGDGVRRAIEDHAAHRWPGARLVMLSGRTGAPDVRVAYTDPTRFGIDRLAALVAARALRPGCPVLVVDAGTAVTIDALDARGRHLGGLIMPGRRLLSEALGGGTSALGAALDSRVECADEELQVSTAAGIEAGIRRMLCSGVWGAIAAIQARGEAPFEVILTGGDAAEVDACGEGAREIRADLVLDGVARMAERFAETPGIA
ncbi:MAG: type III pantothenate kinase [Pseudomonadota bacterium]